MAKHYDMGVRLEIRRLFVQEEKEPHEIANIFDRRPSANTIMKWAKEKNGDEKNWYDQRRERENDEYERISPKSIASKILNRIDEILRKEKFGNADADALAKLQKSLEKIADVRYQIPVMYQLLREYTDFVKSNYRDLICERFVESIKDFRTEIRKKLG
jgi:hypothetical protein